MYEAKNMGMYIGLRFKGIVKEKFRKDFEDIALYGNWEESDNEIFRQFGNVFRSGFIPCGGLAYMPDKWDIEVFDNNFDRTYNEKTGKWTFQCSLKNYNNTIEKFLEIVPYFIEEVEHVEVFYEEWRYSKKYELVDGKMLMTNDKFIEYNKYNY